MLTNEESLLKERSNSGKSGLSLRGEIARYIERCRLEEGGYCFFCIPPASGRDTYYAVKTLAMLGLKPDTPQPLADVFLDAASGQWPDDITGLFLSSEVLAEMGLVSNDFKCFAAQQIMAHKNSAGGFGALENIYIEVSSELEATYHVLKTLKTIGANFDKTGISHFISSLLNPDGGYGREGRSTLATTYYATGLFNLMGIRCPGFKHTLNYLRSRERDWLAIFKNGLVTFMEDVFWLVSALANLGEKPHYTDEIVKFVTSCQRINGGFARTGIMGIPTLEYTFYAVSVLNEVRTL